jgi:hypothetical protein
VLQRHRELAAQFGHQADRVVAQAREHTLHRTQQPEKTVQQSVTYSRNHVFERAAVQDERAILQAAMDRSMGQALQIGDSFLFRLLLFTPVCGCG